MAILRIDRHINKFVVLQTEVLNLENLSWEAKGVWAYLMGRPDNWQPSISHLTKCFPSGKDRLYRIFRELEKFGLCTKHQERLEDGRMSSVIYTIYEVPVFKKCLPDTEKPQAVNPDTEKPTLINNDGNKEMSIRNISPPTPSERGRPPDVGREEKEIDPLDQKIYDEMVSEMKKQKPDCKVPSKEPMIKAISQMRRIDKRDGEQILKVFRWALRDSFWKDKMFVKNPASYLRSKFDNLEIKAKLNKKYDYKQNVESKKPPNDDWMKQILEMNKDKL